MLKFSFLVRVVGRECFPNPHQNKPSLVHTKILVILPTIPITKYLFQSEESEIFQAYQKCDAEVPVIVHDNSISIGTETKTVNIAAYPFHVAGLLKSLAKPVRKLSI